MAQPVTLETKQQNVSEVTTTGFLTRKTSKMGEFNISFNLLGEYDNFDEPDAAVAQETEKKRQTEAQNASGKWHLESHRTGVRALITWKHEHHKLIIPFLCHWPWYKQALRFADSSPPCPGIERNPGKRSPLLKMICLLPGHSAVCVHRYSWF